MSKLTFGADPEFFLYDRKLGDCVPALGVTEGTKSEPEPLWDGFSLQLDGVALEINTPVFANVSSLLFNTANFVNSKRFINLINQRLGATDRYTISRKVCHYFSIETWNDLPDEYKRLGCDPDYNAKYETPELAMNRIPNEWEVGRFRTAAGHIAMGFVEKGENLLEHGVVGFNAARAVAYSLTICYRTYGKTAWRPVESKRRRLYGDWHAFRPKPFGVEWRTPSNAWLYNATARKELRESVTVALNTRLRTEN